MKITTTQIAVLGITTTFLAGVIAPVQAARQARKQRRSDWSVRASEAYSLARAAWSLVGETRLQRSVSVAEGRGLTSDGETSRRNQEAQLAITQLRAVGATAPDPEAGKLAHEIAQRLWQLDHAMVQALNVTRVTQPAEVSERLAPLTKQAENATAGWPGKDGHQGLSLETLFERLEEAIRSAGSY